MRSWTITAGLLILSALGSGCATAPGETPQAKRDRILSMRDESLAMLYAGDPQAKQEVESAPAYAVLNETGGGLLLGGGGGYGVLMQKDSPDPFYIQDLQATVALGLGYQGYRTIIVFHDPAAVPAFRKGTTYMGGQADAGIRFGETGGIARVVGAGAPVRVYRMDPNGVMLRAAIPANFYSPYTKLNASAG